MRKNITISIIIMFAVFSSCGGEHATITVNTPTIQCGMCQTTIENGLKKTLGIKDANVDLKTKNATVTYNIDKTDITKIENVISSLGYQANEIKPDPDIYEALPGCCKVG